MKKLLLLPFCITASLSLSAQEELDQSPPIPLVEQKMQEREPVFTVVEQMPEFEGGSEALLSFISKNMVYPPNASENQIQGTIYLSYVVRSDGSLSDIKVLKSVPGGSDLNGEALRVLKLTKGKWKPGRQNGKPVSVNLSLPIKFSLR